MFNYYNKEEGKFKFGKLSRDIIVVIVVLISVFGSFRVITAGRRGVKLTLGAVSQEVLGEGLHFKFPIVQKIASLDVRTVKYEVNAAAYSKDIQTVDSKIALNYHINPDRANKLYQEIGTDYESRIINPAIQEILKAVSAKFTAQELIEKRESVRDQIRADLAERLSVRSITVDELSIVNFDFSTDYEKAVEAKQVAQQQALKAENDLKRIKTEAEQRVAQAEAEARAIKIQAEAITQQGGKDYVQLKAIERWDGKLPAQMIPNATVPFLDLNK